MPKSILTVLADNPAVLQELERVLLEEFSLDNLSLEKPNFELGEDTRAYLIGKTKVKAVIKRIAALQTPPNNQTRVNPAR